MPATTQRSGSRYARIAMTDTGHVLFNWHAPELWRRFTIALAGR